MPHLLNSQNPPSSPTPHFSGSNSASQHPTVDTRFLNFQDQRTPGTRLFQHLCPRVLHSNQTPVLSPSTLYCSVRGSIISRGLPFTLMRPLPRLQCATAVAVFCGKPEEKERSHVSSGPRLPRKTQTSCPTASPRPRPPSAPSIGRQTHLASEDLHRLQRTLGWHCCGRRQENLTARRRLRKRKALRHPAAFQGLRRRPERCNATGGCFTARVVARGRDFGLAAGS